MPASPAPKPDNHYGWTEERRRLARERALKNKPWEHSTGPRTAAGKARISQNARKYPIHIKEIAHLSKEMLDLHEAFLARFKLLKKLELQEIILKRVRPRTSKNKLIKTVLKQGAHPPPPQNIESKLIKSLRRAGTTRVERFSKREER